MSQRSSSSVPPLIQGSAALQTLVVVDSMKVAGGNFLFDPVGISPANSGTLIMGAPAEFASIVTPDGTTGNAGSLIIEIGTGAPESDGGSLGITSGNGGSNGNGGNLTISTGDSSGTGNAGNISITPGIVSGTGLDGSIYMQGSTIVSGIVYSRSMIRKGVTVSATGVTYTPLEILSGCISKTPSGAGIEDSLPTGTVIDAAFVNTELIDGMSITFAITNLSGSNSFDVTETGSTLIYDSSGTNVGTVTILADGTAEFRAIRTTTNTWKFISN
jgi:hypothetical protein